MLTTSSNGVNLQKMAIHINIKCCSLFSRQMNFSLMLKLPANAGYNSRRNSLANIKSAEKRARQNIKRQMHNRYFASTARTYIKKARLQIAAGDLETAETTIQQATKALDKAAQKGIIHANNAARRKSRLVKALNKAKATEA